MGTAAIIRGAIDILVEEQGLDQDEAASRVSRSMEPDGEGAHERFRSEAPAASDQRITNHLQAIEDLKTAKTQRKHAKTRS